MAKKGSIVMENGNRIDCELYPNEAPNTVSNFEKFINKKFNYGLTLHLVIDAFENKNDCPYGNGFDSAGYTIKCETEGNPHKHVEGSLSMAHAGKDTGSCQFFIVHEPQPHLDGVHTVFGKVTSGMEYVKQMRNGDVMKEVKMTDE